MLEQYVAADLARRKVVGPFEPPAPAKRPATQPQRAVVRATSAKALRRLADRLEPTFGT